VAKESHGSFFQILGRTIVATAEIPYEPRVQFIPFHQRNQRWACLLVHRRGGKTVACINDIIARALFTDKKDGRYAYIAPFYRQAKDVAWAYLKHYAEPAIKKIRESELRVELINGNWITLYGADNPDALRGLYLDGVIMDEFGDARPSLWGTVVLPTLVDRGGWAVFIGTPKGKNHFYHIHRRSLEEVGWYDMTLPASLSGIIAETELEEMRSQMTPEEYDQEMECSFDAALRGTYFADIVKKAESEGRVTPLKIHGDRPVYCSADLGYTDSTFFWFWQLTQHGISVIDAYENHALPIAHYIDYLQELGKHFPKGYEEVWLPHDARARSLQTGRTVMEQFLGSELPVKIVPKLSIQDGIDAVRQVIPRCWFNADSLGVLHGLECLRSYQRKWDEVKQVFANAPLHNWASHGTDAFRGMALVTQDQLPKPRIAADRFASYKDETGQIKTGYCLDDLFEDRDRHFKYAGYNRMRI
jgi:phage terminase large subunit